MVEDMRAMRRGRGGETDGNGACWRRRSLCRADCGTRTTTRLLAKSYQWWPAYAVLLHIVVGV
ncbi:hypothetical protein K523DRAFT_79081 [Schizophyllum commune Tattone D]|nr:hypothetical protein K523DRAFT_79081 [Schizophyllum commune Tattone D]